MAWAGLVILFVLLFFSNGVAFIYSDSYYYYHISRSLVDEGSFVTATLPEYLDYSEYTVSEYQGNFVTVTSPGGGFFLYLPTLISQSLRPENLNLTNDYFLAYNGHTLSTGVLILLNAVIFALGGIWLMYRALRLLNFSKKVSFGSVLAVWFASYAVWYTFLSPGFTHIYEIFTVSLALWAMIKYEQKHRIWLLLIIGIAIGLAFLLRPFLAVLGLCGMVLLWRRRWKHAAALALTFLPFVLVWMGYNQISYGQVFASGYDVIRNEGFISQFNAHNVLFSPHSGLFIYSPLLLLSTIGLIIKSRQKNLLAILGLIFFVFLTLVYGFWSSWWAGASFGQRFLLPVLPFFALGLAYFWQFMRAKLENGVLQKGAILAIGVLLGWSLLLTGLFRFTPVAELVAEQDATPGLPASESYTPVDMLTYHRDLIVNAESFSGYVSDLAEGGHGGVPLFQVLLGGTPPVLKQQNDNFYLLKNPYSNVTLPEYDSITEENFEDFLKQNSEVVLK